MIEAQESSTSLFTEYEVAAHERVVDDGASTVQAETVLGESNEQEYDGVASVASSQENTQQQKDAGCKPQKKDAVFLVFLIFLRKKGPVRESGS